MLTERKLGTNPVLQRRQARLLQPCDLALGERLKREIGQRRTAPQPQRLTQRLARAPRIARLQRAATGNQQRPEAIDIHLATIALQNVTTVAGEEHSVAERLAELGYIHL